MLIVDAANVLHAAHGMSWPVSEVDPRGLVRLVAAQRLGRRGAWVVFDGVRPLENAPQEVEGVQLRWSGTDREADDVIEDLITIETAPASLLVVSTDRRLRHAARRAGATSETSRDFLSRAYRRMLDRAHRLTAPAQREEVPLGRGALRSWLKEFGFDPALADRVPAPPPRERPTRTRPDRTRPNRANPPPPPARADTASKSQPESQPEPPRPAIDDELAELLKEWGGGILPTDLDMQTWIGPDPT